MITRRTFLKKLGALTAAGTGTASYAFVLEPRFMLNTTVKSFTPPGWTPGLKLRAVLLADPHVVEPYMPLSRWQAVIEAANALAPDVVFLLGDYVSGLHPRLATVPVADTARAAARLKAPLGVYSVNGNHDWWGDAHVQKTMQGPPEAQRAFEDAGIAVLANRAVRLVKDGQPFWVTGTDSTVAFHNRGHGFISMADLPRTMNQVTDDAPIIHLAHEPDLFVDVPRRVSLTLSGHTHGGQLRIAGYSPVVPSGYGNRFAYGHVVENGQHLFVSGGLGVSTIPFRFGVPPEINVLELG
ncbi:MAG: metallophosphoesterase [Alphaproteobacteria bacterium]|nr:metallophosphoesterase [Alphaproteobacteria bacterium]